MEECSVLIESTLPAEDKTSRWFNLPIDYELFRDLLGVESDSGDYQIIDMKLTFAGDIVRTTSVRRLNKLYFANRYKHHQSSKRKLKKIHQLRLSILYPYNKTNSLCEVI